MKTIKKLILILAFLLPLISFSQEAVFEIKAVASGEGVWYAHIPNTAAGDFLVERNNEANRVKNGVLEAMDANFPLISWLDGEPHALIQPARSNKILNPLTFSDWTLSGATLEGDPATAGSEIHTQSNAASDPNGNAANATTGWVGANATLTSDASAPQTGTYSLKGVATTSTFESINYAFTAVVGQMYKVTIWAKRGSQGTDQGIRSWGNMSDFEAVLIESTNWTKYTIYATATTTAPIIRVYSVWTTGAIGDEVYVDNVSIKEVTGYSSPSVDYPVSGLKLVEDETTGYHRTLHPTVSVTSGDILTFSLYAKYIDKKYILIQSNTLSIFDIEITFDLEKGIVDTETHGTGTITILSNGWFRLTATGDVNTTGTAFGAVYMLNNVKQSSYTGDGSSIYIAFPTLEQGSYATTPILPPVGSPEGVEYSRAADVITGAGSAEIFQNINSSGVFFINTSTFLHGQDNMAITLSDGSINNYLGVLYRADGDIWAQLLIGGATKGQIIATISEQNYYHKIAYRYKSGNISLWIDGKQVGSTITDTFTTPTFIQLQFARGDAAAEYFYGNARTVAVYPYLTNYWISTLTSPTGIAIEGQY